MRVRRHQRLLLCTAGVCLLSLLYYFKTLHQETLLQKLTSYSSQLTGFHSFLWQDTLPKSPISVTRMQKIEGLYKDIKENPSGDDLRLLNAAGPHGKIHEQMYVLRDEPTFYFHNMRGALCCIEGIEKESNRSKDPAVAERQRKLLNLKNKRNESISRDQPVISNQVWEEPNCVCRQGWHGPNCGIPTVVQHSNLATKSHLKPRKVPRRIINAININHEFDMLHARFHELADTVDLFMVCESNYTAFGKAKPLNFLRQLLNGTFNYVKHKILYIFLDHFPKGGHTNGWIADDYLRTFLTKNGLMRLQGLRPDDVFILDDADEIPLREGIRFLKFYDGWTEPFGIHLRKSLYGFFWRQPGTLDILSGCTIGMLINVYRGDGILLRRRDYYSMTGFREYEKNSGHVLMKWSIGSPVHYAGWHCSWCFPPEGIYYKLISAQNGDFPRWGDYEEKLKLSYIRELIQTGRWFDGSVPRYPQTDHGEHMYAPKYILDNFKKYHYLLKNPYAKG